MNAESKLPEKIRPLFKAALAARSHSHSPYSGYKVGAALQTSEGKTFAGCNVENSTYGATVCAERSAVQTAVGAVGAFKLLEILVVTDATPAWPPCGICRQVLSEFGTPDTLIHAVNLQGDLHTTTLGALLPNAFTPAHLA